MTKTKFALGFCASLLCACLAGKAQAQSPYPVVQGKYYKFQKISDGVYYATAAFNGTEFPFGSNPFFGANLVVIVNKDDVVLVDSATSPRAARALIADVKRLTDKPIRTVVNTHWHYDHTDGNSAFGPDVQIIGHDYVRHAIETFDILHNEPFPRSTLPVRTPATTRLPLDLAIAAAPVIEPFGKPAPAPPPAPPAGSAPPPPPDASFAGPSSIGPPSAAAGVSGAASAST